MIDVAQVLQRLMKKMPPQYVGKWSIKDGVDRNGDISVCTNGFEVFKTEEYDVAEAICDAFNAAMGSAARRAKTGSRCADCGTEIEAGHTHCTYHGQAIADEL